MTDTEEKRLRVAMLNEVGVVVARLNHKLQDYADKGIHPVTLVVYPPGSNCHGEVFDSYRVDLDVFRPDQ